MSKSILQIIYSCFVKKPLQKTPNIKKNETILKIGHHENAIAHEVLTLVQKLKFQKTRQNPFYKSFTVVLCKKPLQKTPNIREMRPF